MVLTWRKACAKPLSSDLLQNGLSMGEGAVYAKSGTMSYARALRPESEGATGKSGMVYHE